MTETQRAAMRQALDAIDWLRHHLTEHHACLHMSPQNSGIPAWVDKTEAALRAAPAEPEQEPEPFIVRHYAADERPTIKGNGFDGLEVGSDRDEAEQFVSWLNARITTPPARRPLTDEEIRKVWRAACEDPLPRTTEALVLAFARSIERAHGITGGNDE